MSFSPISYLQPLSLPLPPVDIRSYVNNYLVERSFCDNWTEESLVHFPVKHPAAGSISAGDHYFEWRIKGRSLPLCMVTFSILPFVNAENPICYHNTSPRTGALNCYIFFYTVPGHLPEQIENTLFNIGDQGNGCNTATFVNFLQDFCTSFYQKVSPTSPSTNPLEL